MIYTDGTPTIAWAPVCTCPADAAGPWDCLDCEVHGEADAKALDAMHASEIAAENAWLTHAENAGAFEPEYAR
jgi:hypothetical protein